MTENFLEWNKKKTLPKQKTKKTKTINELILNVDINRQHRDMIMLHVNMIMLHVNMIMLTYFISHLG